MLTKNVFFLLWKVEPFYWGHERWDNQMPCKLICERQTFFFGLFCPSLPTLKVLVYIGIFVQVYQRWKLWFLLAFFIKVCQRWKFWSFWPQFRSLATLPVNTNGECYVVWSLPLSNLWLPAPPRASSRSPEAISNTLLWKQEFVLQEAIAGTGLETLHTYVYRCGNCQAFPFIYISHLARSWAGAPSHVAAAPGALLHKGFSLQWMKRSPAITTTANEMLCIELSSTFSGQR